MTPGARLNTRGSADPARRASLAEREQGRWNTSPYLAAFKKYIRKSCFQLLNEQASDMPWLHSYETLNKNQYSSLPDSKA